MLLWQTWEAASSRGWTAIPWRCCPASWASPCTPLARTATCCCLTAPKLPKSSTTRYRAGASLGVQLLQFFFPRKQRSSLADPTRRQSKASKRAMRSACGSLSTIWPGRLATGGRSYHGAPAAPACRACEFALNMFYPDVSCPVGTCKAPAGWRATPCLEVVNAPVSITAP